MREARCVMGFRQQDGGVLQLKKALETFKKLEVTGRREHGIRGAREAKCFFPPAGWDRGTTYNKALFARVCCIFRYNRRCNRGITRLEELLASEKLLAFGSIYSRGEGREAQGARRGREWEEEAEEDTGPAFVRLRRGASRGNRVPDP